MAPLKELKDRVSGQLLTTIPPGVMPKPPPHISGGEHPPNFTVLGKILRAACQRRHGGRQTGADVSAAGQLSHSHVVIIRFPW